jgi:hypothetical protein
MVDKLIASLQALRRKVGAAERKAIPTITACDQLK